MRFGYRLQEIMFHFLYLSSTRIVQDFQLCNEFCIYFVHACVFVICDRTKLSVINFCQDLCN